MTFTSSLREAMDTTDGLAYIERVKTVVRNQIQRLDNTARIEDTQYYNHSAIPDFVVTWPGERGERRIYLRDSYSSIAAGDDERYLGKFEPVLLALDNDDSRRGIGDPVGSSARTVSPRTLVTDAEAVEIISGEDNTASAESPINSLVRANFVRGGKGHIDHDRAELLVDGRADNSAGIDAIADIIADSFVEDAALRITRTAQLIDFAMNGPGAGREIQSVAAGKLSLAEIRHLLPWLLSQPAASENYVFWRFIGNLMTFDELELIREDIAGMDISPLIWANSDVWEAKWAYLGVSRIVDEQSGPNPSLFRWSFDSGRLSVDIGGDQRVLIARNGKLIRAREGRSSAAWDDLQAPLSAYRLARVVLRGIRRSVSIDAVESPDVRSDVEDVANSLEDRYYVTEATLRVPSSTSEDGQTDLVVDFGGSIIRAKDSASIRDLITVASQVLNYRSPVDSATLNQILGASNSGVSESDEDGAQD
ncbi:hypothetical protein IRT45_19445 [Nocardia sp. BSTN01]|uniref:hypothetical protein n=1 Tax=Nocardia sp. BSTN01 TaxID=2783665 RepID=UPI00189047A4|nr:hypothetical protein [Nocardia sp. BSTN01]MBF4999326.1 hypothetical protein [Nocardia sp. BSTN01]